MNGDAILYVGDHICAYWPWQQQCATCLVPSSRRRRVRRVRGAPVALPPPPPPTYRPPTRPLHRPACADTDAALAKMRLNWRTALIIAELEQEIGALAQGRQHRKKLKELLNKKDMVGDCFNQLRLARQRALNAQAQVRRGGALLPTAPCWPPACLPC